MNWKKRSVQKSQKPRRHRRKSNSFWLIAAIVTLIGMTVALQREFVIRPIWGTSMEASLHTGDLVLVKKSGEVERYDVVAFRAAAEKEDFVKRVIGMPEDPIIVQGRRLVIDLGGKGDFLVTYSVDLSEEVATALQNLTNIPLDCYFVIGDNTSVSKDSRSIGLIKKTELEGRIIQVLYHAK